MAKALYFVVGDLFVPLFVQLGRKVHEELGLAPMYLSFVPRDNLWLKKNAEEVFPKNVYSLDGLAMRQGLFHHDEAAQLSAFMRTKHGGAEKTWTQRLNHIAAYLHDLVARHDIRVMVLWNGEDHVGRVMTVIARKAGIPILFMENGYFPNTLQADPSGVNSSSSLVDKGFEQLRDELARARHVDAESEPSPLKPITPLQRADFLLSSLKRKADPSYYRRFPEHRGSSWLVKKRLEQARKKIPVDKVVLPDEFVFIPLQVHDDTQVLLNCRHFNTVEAFFTCAHQAVRRNFGPEMKIVVKEHPEDLCRYSYEAFRQQFPDVIWLKKYDVDELLDRATCVVLINSSVGLQAVKRGKPTVVFGQSFYSRDEVAFPVHDLQQVDAVFQRARQGVSTEMAGNIRVFMDYLEQVYFFKGSWKSVDAECVARAAAKVRSLLAMPPPSVTP